jgi:uncharacterized protein (DUF58 family)
MWGKSREPAPMPSRRREPMPSLLRRVQWMVMRPLATYLGGDERSTMRGAGIELSEVREYQPGDDVRHIDWNITARSDRTYIRESQVERALDVWLLLDVSASIDWGTAECLKRDRAVEFAAVAGQLLGRHGNRIGALLFADRPVGFMPPASGRTHLMRLLAAIQNEPRQTRQGPTNLLGALKRAQTVIRKRSLIVVVSDFLAVDGWQSMLGDMAQRHEIVAVRLSDPRESELPPIGIVALEDPETGSQLTIDTHDHRVRARFRAAAEAQTARIESELARRGVDTLTLSTGTPILPALVQFLAARRLRRGQPSAHTQTAHAQAPRVGVPMENIR